MVRGSGHLRWALCRAGPVIWPTPSEDRIVRSGGILLQLDQARYEEHNRLVQKLVDDVPKSAPAGSEAMIAAWKSAITSSAALSESLQRTAQQTAEIAERSLKALTEAGSKVAASRTDRKIPGATTH